MVVQLDSDIKERMAGLKRAMAEGAGGKTLKRELSKRLRDLMNPLVQQQKSRVLRLPSKGHQGPSMRQAIARQTKAATRGSGQNMGVQIIQRARAMPRGFDYAGRAFNRADGWNPTTLGGETVHQEIRPAGWFDDVTDGQRPKVGREVLAALDATAAKIAARAR
jgi:hypothetical protein